MGDSGRFRVLCGAAAVAASAIDAWWGQTYSLRILVVPPILGLAYRAGSLTAVATAFLSSVLWTILRQSGGESFDATLLWEAATRFGTLAIMSLVVARLRRRVVNERTAAETDELTGLANRRGFDRWKRTVCGRLVSTGAAVTVVYFDVDRFKQINDVRGHAAGDRVLRTIGAALQAATRQNDLVCRWGGDEFLVILTETPVDSVPRILDRISQRLRTALRELDDAATVSGGTATGIPAHGAAALIDEADARLTLAKAAGGDRIVGDEAK